MRVRNSLTGKYEHLEVGQAVCGKRFSEITFTPQDRNAFHGTRTGNDRTMEWLEHLLLTRLGIKTK